MSEPEQLRGRRRCYLQRRIGPLHGRTAGNDVSVVGDGRLRPGYAAENCQEKKTEHNSPIDFCHLDLQTRTCDIAQLLQRTRSLRLGELRLQRALPVAVTELRLSEAALSFRRVSAPEAEKPVYLGRHKRLAGTWLMRQHRGF